MPITLTKKTDAIIVTWKEYDASPIKDSGIEVNDKGVEHYLIISGQKFKSVVTEDSLYNNGSRLGEKIQSEYFNINPSLTISAVIHSSFLKDTTIKWQGETVPCIVIQFETKLTLKNPNDTTKQQNEISNTLYHFGKNVGLIKYSSERNGDFSIWELQEIKKIED